MITIEICGSAHPRSMLRIESQINRIGKNLLDAVKDLPPPELKAGSWD
jgi:hypothetical protein